MGDKETRWWNEEVQERIQREMLARKKCNSEKMKESSQNTRRCNIRK